jgi:hypothetical protein
MVDQQLIESADESLRSHGSGAADFWRLWPGAKAIREGKNDWRIELRARTVEVSVITDGRLTVELAGTVWRLIHGDAPIETVRMSREEGKDRMIIEGQDKKHGRLILEIHAENSDAGPKKDEAAGTPPGGAAAGTSAATLLVESAVEYLSRENRGAENWQAK